MTVTGTEPCNLIREDTGEVCPNLARWCFIDGRPAFDHYNEFCDRCLTELCGEDPTGVFPLIPGESHPVSLMGWSGVRVELR